jgi:hypothetical protein
MMAEGLAALGLVASIVQFIDFGSRLVHQASEIKDAGSTEENDDHDKIGIDLQRIARNLLGTNSKLRRSLEPANNSPGDPFEQDHVCSAFISLFGTINRRETYRPVKDSAPS